MKIGYFLSSEEWGPRELVAQAVKAEQAGFEGLWISDHYHPWNDEQGHSPFVWSTIGAIAQATDAMKLTTAVTCPTIRIHPAIVAQAAATSAVLLEGRFCLGLGSGEALNEHILGPRLRLARPPSADRDLRLREQVSRAGSADRGRLLHSWPGRRRGQAVSLPGRNGNAHTGWAQGVLGRG